MTGGDKDVAAAFVVTLPPEGWGELDEGAARNRAVIREMFARMAAGDLTAMVGMLAPDVRFVQAPGLPYAVDVTGIEAAMGGLGAMIKAWARLDACAVDVLASGDTVIALVDMTGTSSTSGRRYSGPVAELFRFEDGLIVEWRPIYWDTHAVQEICQ